MLLMLIIINSNFILRFKVPESLDPFISEAIQIFFKVDLSSLFHDYEFTIRIFKNTVVFWSLINIFRELKIYKRNSLNCEIFRLWALRKAHSSNIWPKINKCNKNDCRFLRSRFFTQILNTKNFKICAKIKRDFSNFSDQKDLSCRSFAIGFS